MFACLNKYFSCNKKSQELVQMQNQIQIQTQPVLSELQKAEQLLQGIEYNNTIKYIPSITYGKVVKVYDGDTITIAAYLDSDRSVVYRFSVRLNGIDSPEIKGKTETEKNLAKKSRDALYNLIYGKIVKLENISIEKYGRLLANVVCDGINVNNWMLENNYAVSYDGGTKIIPEDWTEQNNYV
jgi:endonuclease YncB( thermonuclease family)